MLRAPVSSSNLVSVGFDPHQQLLEIEFKAGTVYLYSGVPESIYRGLMGASSHGSYFHANIRGRFPYRRVR
jgi:hypothetical protein